MTAVPCSSLKLAVGVIDRLSMLRVVSEAKEGSSDGWQETPMVGLRPGPCRMRVRNPIVDPCGRVPNVRNLPGGTEHRNHVVTDDDAWARDAILQIP
jgi:hypothetical protein